MKIFNLPQKADFQAIKRRREESSLPAEVPLPMSTIGVLKSSCQNILSRITLIMIFMEYGVKYWT